MRASRKELDPELEALRHFREAKRAHNIAEEPDRIRRMLEQCHRFGVAVRQLSEYSFRLTRGERWVDYWPRTRKVFHGNEAAGYGLEAALEYLGIPRRPGVRRRGKATGEKSSPGESTVPDGNST